MARTSSSGLKGFSILQPFLGAPLAWLPAVGTKDLDDLVNAYVAGPGTIQEKRTVVSIEFFEYSAQTGENFKYYPVNAPAASATPATSFSASPAMSDMSYSGSSPSQASTPAANMTRTANADSTDFSHLPGMKILTIDGQDVTNSISRGCKTKAQREHAHLMRVLKACDACKRKKIRCDPSHKRRASAQGKKTAGASKPAAKKARKEKTSSTPASASPSQSAASVFTPAPEASFDIDMSVFEGIPAMDQSWDEFLTFDSELINNAPVPQNFYGAVPQDFDFFFDAHDNQFSPAISGSSGSFDSPAQPLTPVNSGMPASSNGGDITFNDNQTLAFLGQESTLPYLNPAGAAHGSNYVDFNLFSPASSFIDEEPQKLKAGDKRKASALQAASEPSIGVQAPHTGGIDAGSRPSSGEALSAHGLAHAGQWRFDHSESGTSTGSPQGHEWQVPAAQRQQDGQAGDGRDSYLQSVSIGNQRSSHADNTGRSSGHAATATSIIAHSLPILQQSRHSSVTAAALLEEGRETSNSRAPGSPGQATATIAPVSPPPSSQVVLGPRAYGVQQDNVVPTVGSAHIEQWTISPPEIQELFPVRGTPRQSTSTPGSALSSSVVAEFDLAITAIGLSPRVEHDAQRRQLPAGGQLPIAGGLQSTGGLHHVLLSTASAVVNVSSPTAPTAPASHETASIPVRESGLRPEGEDRPQDEERSRTAGVSSSSPSASGPAGLGSYPRVISHGPAQRQTLHGIATAPAANTNAASSLPQRLLKESAVPTLPVRQSLGDLTSSQLVVFGFVTFLLLTMAFTSFAQHLQMQQKAPPIFAHHTSTSIVFLSLLSLSAQHNLRSKSGALDSVMSSFRHATSSRRCRDAPGRAAWARVATACF